MVDIENLKCCNKAYILSSSSKIQYDLCHDAKQDFVPLNKNQSIEYAVSKKVEPKFSKKPRRKAKKIVIYSQVLKNGIDSQGFWQTDNMHST